MGWEDLQNGSKSNQANVFASRCTIFVHTWIHLTIRLELDIGHPGKARLYSIHRIHSK